MTDQPPTLEVFEALAKRRGHLGIAEDVERLDDALVKLPRHDREHRASPSRDAYRALGHPCEFCRQVERAPARLGDRKLGHLTLLANVHQNVHLDGQDFKCPGHPPPSQYAGTGSVAVRTRTK